MTSFPFLLQGGFSSKFSMNLLSPRESVALFFAFAAHGTAASTSLQNGGVPPETSADSPGRSSRERTVRLCAYQSVFWAFVQVWRDLVFSPEARTRNSKTAASRRS